MKRSSLLPLSLYRQSRRLLGQVFVGFFPPSACRFIPTCSVYCEEAIGKYGFCRGLVKCLWRVLRCHPLSRGGYDPV